jgi:peroxiredoxin Q/BCP
MGIERSTFLVGPDGKIEHVWRKVKPEGHADEVLTQFKSLSK